MADPRPEGAVRLAVAAGPGRLEPACAHGPALAAAIELKAHGETDPSFHGFVQPGSAHEAAASGSVDQVMLRKRLRALVATTVTALTLVACESGQEGPGASRPTPPIGLDQALTYEVLQTEDISSSTRRRVRAFIYSPAESVAARVQTSMKAAVEIQRDAGCHYVKIFHLILPDPNQIGLGTYYVDLSYAPDGLGVSGEAPLRMGEWEALATDEVVDDLTLEVERLWWSHRQRFQRPDGYGGTETDEEAMKTFIAEELDVDPTDVKLASLWLELYDPET